MSTHRLVPAFVASLLLAGPASAAVTARANPVLFVTQAPIPDEVNNRDINVSFMSSVSPFSNHLGDTKHAARGGSLWVLMPDGSTRDLLAAADWTALFPAPALPPTANQRSLRNPAVHWSGTKAVFSMVLDAPGRAPADLWQLYEITLSQLASGAPVVTRVANQPAYDNVFPTYAPDGRIVFASDRPYDGSPHLKQREEYLGLPSTSGLWSLDPSDAASLKLLVHSPSGAFWPTIDSDGRLVFTNWDHLSRDVMAVSDARDPTSCSDGTTSWTENFVRTTNGAGNFASESSTAAFTPVTALKAAGQPWDVFPEPRNADNLARAPGYPTTCAFTIAGNTFNLFMPWQVNLDGTGSELLNHVGRHEIGALFGGSFPLDTNLVTLNPGALPSYLGGGSRRFASGIVQLHEDRLHPGTFVAVDAVDLGTHSAGQIIQISNGAAGQNPDTMTITYRTPGAVGPKPVFPPPGGTLSSAEHWYRTPILVAPQVATGNLLLLASHASTTTLAHNSGTAAAPASPFDFRLYDVAAAAAVTPAIPMNATWVDGGLTVNYSGNAWQLDPVEVVARTAPTPHADPVDPIEAGVFATQGVHLPTFQSWLRANNAALSVSRDVTKRDYNDRQQPYNLRIAWSGHQTVANGGTVYPVAYVEFLEADLRRGYLGGGASPLPGRRVVATPLHTTWSENVHDAGAPQGSLRLGDDGSFAAIVPAGKALTWHLTNNDAAHTSQVKERYWVTFAAGEVRTCANCHGLNSKDQAGVTTKPQNPPAALAALLTQWKGQHPAGVLEYAQNVASAVRNAGSVRLDVTRANGSTGPAQVAFTTTNGTAVAGTDFTATSGTLAWADGDTSAKSIQVPVIDDPNVTQARSFTVTLSGPQYVSLGAKTVATVTLTPDPPVAVAPQVTTEPVDVSVTAGQPASFSVTASGTGPLTYAWKRGTSVISGETGSTLTLATTALADDGARFTAVVTNSAGTATSRAALLTVVAPPQPPHVDGQPSDQSVTAGQQATFTVVASGSGTLAYQWYRGPSAIGGATEASYTTPSTTLSDDGATYSVVVSNAVGIAPSRAALLSVTPAPQPPAITSQPADDVVNTGEDAIFTVGASGTNPLQFQWFRGTQAISGATSATYRLLAASAADDGARFHAVVTNAYGTATTADARLTVRPPPPVAPQFTVQPADVTAFVGARATFVVEASGTAPLRYQWYRGPAAIEGATTASYTTPVLGLGDDGVTHTAVAINDAGLATSRAARLTVIPAPQPPAISSEPSDVTVDLGAPATFQVTATGTGPLQFQWFREQAALGGATNASYTIDPTVAADDGASFHVVVTNAHGTATSREAGLTLVFPSTPDAGETVDAGGEEVTDAGGAPDAGEIADAGGTTDADAGTTPTVDAGTGEPPTPTGCGCDAGATPSGLFAAGLVFAGRRRRTAARRA